MIAQTTHIRNCYCERPIDLEYRSISLSILGSALLGRVAHFFYAKKYDFNFQKFNLHFLQTLHNEYQNFRYSTDFYIMLQSSTKLCFYQHFSTFYFFFYNIYLSTILILNTLLFHRICRICFWEYVHFTTEKNFYDDSLCALVSLRHFKCLLYCLILYAWIFLTELLAKVNRFRVHRDCFLTAKVRHSANEPLRYARSGSSCLAKNLHTCILFRVVFSTKTLPFYHYLPCIAVEINSTRKQLYTQVTI